MLPHLRDRSIVAQRWPDGIDEFTWYQHRVPPNAPDYLPGVWIEGNRRILLPDRGALLWMVNQAALTLHGWSSRVTTTTTTSTSSLVLSARVMLGICPTSAGRL